MRNKRRIAIGIMVAILLVGGGVAASQLWDLPAARTGRGVVPVRASASPAPAAALNPLTIAAMRSRAYPGGPITLVQDLGDQGGYTASIASFASDGLIEHTYWAQPNGTLPAGGWPVIVLVHGYIPPTQYNTVTNAYTSWIAAWARAGFVVVQPDLRGNGTSDGSAVSGHWSPDYTYDVMNLIASLKKEPNINPGHIGLVGHSMGGHVALNVAVISPDVAGTMLVNGVVGSMYDLFYNWPNSPAPSDQPAATVKAELSGLINAHGTPKTDPEFWNQASAINYMSGVVGPVQIDADTGDTTVPAAFSLKLNAALAAAHKPVTIYTYAGNDHQLSSVRNLPLFLARSTAFWRRVLG